MEDAAETNSVFEDLVDVQNSVVRLLRSTICHVIYMQYHLRHPLPLFNQSNPVQKPWPYFHQNHTQKSSLSLSLSRSYSLPRSTASIQFCPSLPLSRCVYEEFGIFRFWPRSAKKLLFFYLKRDEGRRVWLWESKKLCLTIMIFFSFFFGFSTLFPN